MNAVVAQEMKTKRKWLLLIMLVVIAFVVVVVIHAVGRSDRAVAAWSGEFRQCRTLEQVRKLAASARAGPNRINIRIFENGDWVAGRMEHACCSGAGFNANVLYDSRGRLFIDTETSLCGFEGLAFEMESVNATTLDTFYPTLTELKLKEVK